MQGPDLWICEDEMAVNERNVKRVRGKSELPSVVTEEGWRYHHIGIPTQSSRPNELHLPALKVYVSSPYGIQWMRFEPDGPYPDIQDLERMAHRPSRE